MKKKVFGTKDKPRLSVHRSLKHIFAQLISDEEGKTFAAVFGGGNVAAAQEAGKQLAQRAKALGISKATFDRGKFPYRGRVKALAEAARSGGLEF